MSRTLAATLTAAIAAGGCVAQTYRIPPAELARLAQTPPADRGQAVRVVQDLSNADEPPGAAPVTAETQIIIVQPVDVVVGSPPRPIGPAPGPMPTGGGGTTGGVATGTSSGGGHADDAKAEAIAYLAAAVVAVVVLAATEGERYDGWVQMHPMMPVHLWGPGGYTVVPLAQIDPQTAMWAERAVVVPGEGPWRELGRAPLDRQGLTYSVLLGASDVVSADGSVGTGAGGHIMIGGYFTHMIGLLGDFDFAWGPNQVQATNFAARASLELDVLPVDLGPLHGGIYGELGFVRRQEDGLPNADATSGRDEIGTLIQVSVNTRLALTARLGLGRELGAQIRDMCFGLSIY
jgi:hypothetical protein